MTRPYLIAGLGNPGPRYAKTRHNAGFWFLDEIARREGIAFRDDSRLHAQLARLDLSGRDCLLAKPTTFMNHSGMAIRALLDYFRLPVAGLLVAYDDLDLAPGIARLKQGGGHGGHNGLRDIFQHVPDHAFLRLRIGIGHPGSKDAVTDYVLSRPAGEQDELIRTAVRGALDVLPLVLAGELPHAMKQLHTPASAS